MASSQLRTLQWKYPPHTRSNNQLEAPNPLKLDFLEDLRIFGDAHLLLTHLYAPNLVTFGHGDPQPGDIRDDGIFGPEARFPSLRHMTLVGSHHTSAEDLRRLFRNHPLLERVKFSMSLPSPEDWMGLLALVETGQEPDSQRHPRQRFISPYLRSITINSADFGIHAQASGIQTLPTMLRTLLRASDGGFSISISGPTVSPPVQELEAEFPAKFFITTQPTAQSPGR